MSVRYPQKLNKNTLVEEKPLHPERLSLVLNLIPKSTAQMSLPEGETLGIHDFVKIFAENGYAGIYRVNAIVPNYPGGVDVSLEHGVVVLRDAYIKGEGSLEGTFRDIVSELLKYQVAEYEAGFLFELGVFPSTPKIKIKYNNDSIFDLLRQACEKMVDYMLVIDQSALPWKIGCKAIESSPIAEARFNRNLSSVVVDVDDSLLCTRLYVVQENEDGTNKIKHYDSNTISSYGVIESVYEPPYGATDASIEEYATEFLERYKEPATAIDVEAQDIYKATAESVDKIELGKTLRCCMPDYGVTVDNKIVSITYKDVLSRPDAVVVSLKNRQKDLADVIKEIRREIGKAGRGSGRAQAKQEKKNKEFSDLIYNADIKIADNKSYIDLYVEKFNALTDKTTQLQIKLDGELETIYLRATQLEKDVETAKSQIAVNAEGIESRVEKGKLISSINQTAETIQIQASKINLSGYVTASQLSATNATINNLMTGVTEASALKASLVNGTTVSGTYGRFDYLYHGGNQIFRRSIEVSTPSGKATINYLGYN